MKSKVENEFSETTFQDEHANPFNERTLRLRDNRCRGDQTRICIAIISFQKSGNLTFFGSRQNQRTTLWQR